MKLYKLIQSKEALVRLGSLPLTAKAAYKVGKAMRAVQGELEIYDKAAGMLFEKYGEVNESGQRFISPDNARRGDFEREHKELLDTDVALGVPSISLEEITVQISAADLLDLDYLITAE